MILVVGFTPTVQRTMWFSEFVPGDVNRARETFVTASGKASNVARVAATLGGNVRLIHPLGGDSGRFVERALADDGVKQDVVRLADAPTRTCTTILTDSGETTELVEEACPIVSGDVARVLERVETALSAGGETIDALVLSGSLPPGTEPEIYGELARMAARAGVPVYVDAQKAALLAAISAGVAFAKPNRQEAAAALSETLTENPRADAARLARRLIDSGANSALVSLGKDGAVLLESAGGEPIFVPSVLVDAVNPIGSGDSMLAGLLVGRFVKRLSLPDAVRYAAAVAAANCLTKTSGVVEPADVERLFGRGTRSLP